MPDFGGGSAELWGGSAELLGGSAELLGGTAGRRPSSADPWDGSAHAKEGSAGELCPEILGQSRLARSVRVARSTRDPFLHVRKVNKKRDVEQVAGGDLAECRACHPVSTLHTLPGAPEE